MVCEFVRFVFEWVLLQGLSVFGLNCFFGIKLSIYVCFYDLVFLLRFGYLSIEYI